MAVRGEPESPRAYQPSSRKPNGNQHHDLRGFAMTRLALAGASVPEIATLTGYSLADVESILDRLYLRRRSSRRAP